MSSIGGESSPAHEAKGSWEKPKEIIVHEKIEEVYDGNLKFAKLKKQGAGRPEQLLKC